MPITITLKDEKELADFQYILDEFCDTEGNRLSSIYEDDETKDASNSHCTLAEKLNAERLKITNANIPLHLVSQQLETAQYLLANTNTGDELDSEDYDSVMRKLENLQEHITTLQLKYL